MYEHLMYWFVPVLTTPAPILVLATFALTACDWPNWPPAS